MMDKLMHWCVHRAKFKRITNILLVLVIVTVLQVYIQQTLASSLLSCDNLKCVHGLCKEGRCLCDQGWQGSSCQSCGGRVRLSENSGYIADGSENYTIEMQCTWLIDSKQPNSTIRLQIVNFETECSWDHLYIFDGGSVFSPLLAAYSGVMLRDGENEGKLPEMVAYSGRAYLYFYSDAAFNMSGFNISYSINSCPRNCSGHGVCVDDVCTCWAGWTGEACDIPICSPGCANHGHCDKEQHMCICDPGYTGSDCSFKIEDGWWEEISTKGTVQGRALHQSVVVGDAMWVVGGENFDHKVFHNIVKFNFSTNSWEKILVTSAEPANRFGHSLIEYENNLYMYGGMLYNGTVKNELWKFDIAKKSWTMLVRNKTNHNCLAEPCNPLAVVGHTATLVSTPNGHKMIIIFGHNPLYGYLNSVQEYNFTTGKWELVATRGAIVKGGFGHTSVYDRRTQQIYVYGGYHSYGAEAALVDFLYSYNLWRRTWKLLTPSHSHRYMHSAVIKHGLMLVYGGNTHNNTSFNNGDQCFSSDFLAYDIACETWHTLKFPASSETGIARFGHTAVLYNESMYVFGGFNGQMLNDIEKFNPGSCRTYLTSEECDRAARGVNCIWDYETSKCQLFSTHVSPSCGQKTENVTSLCARQTLCPSCIENSYNCVWCGTSCYHGRCSRGMKETRLVEQCEEAQSSNCDKLHNCHACHTEYHCGWQKDDKCYTFVRETGNGTKKATLLDDYRVKCELPCSSRTSCENCTQGSCMWCSSQELCIEANSYAAVFPVGQCMKWTTQQFHCSGLMCKDIQTCDLCQKNPRCGWCDNGSGTGLGRCYEGSDLGVMIWNGTAYVLNETICPAHQWYFTSCPTCQCNGHSICVNGTDVCQQPCQHLTEGAYCQNCMPGYYGYPVNGGNCTPCFCNNHSHLCHQETGTCYCNTKGISGKHCHRCDESNQYMGYPTEEGGSCYYNLSIDFQYTFNMSKPEDRHYTNINFINVPVKPDVDVEFIISCTGHALVNITISSSSSADQLLHGSAKCEEKFSTHISHVDYVFGADNTTFYVRVFDFTTPFIIKISFSQHRTLDLLQFFITFSSCFLSLLIIAAVLWKIKQKYDLYRRRQRLFVEMEQMASRPFAGVALEIEKGNQHISEINPADGRKKNHPTPIALEPCSGGKAAVLSLIVRMPLGNEDYTPDGQSGLAIASALVSLGTLCKNVDAIKENSKLDNWKSSNSSTCI